MKMEFFDLSLRSLKKFFACWVISVFLFAGPAAAQFLGSNSAEETPEASSASSSTQTLLDVLKDEEARAALIADLEASIAQSSDAQAETEIESQTLAQRLASLTMSAAENTFLSFSAMWRDVSGIGTLVSGLSDSRSQRISEAWLPLFLTVVSTISILLFLTWLTSGWLAKRQRPNPDKRLGTTLVSTALNAVTDVVVLGVAYASGYLLALLVFGEEGKILVEQSLYLNAFLIAGILRITLRIFVLPDRPEMALSQFSTGLQKVIYARSKFIIFLIVYGINVAVPIANAWLSLAMGRSIRVIVVTLAALGALFTIRKISQILQREAISAQQSAIRKSEIDEDDVIEVIGEASIEAVTSIWSRVWPWLAGAYVAAIYLIAIAQPQLTADLVGLATVKTLGVCALIAVAFRLFKYSKSAQVPIPAMLASSLPQIRSRLDGFAPMVVNLSALICLVFAFGLLLDAWHIVDVSGWISGETGNTFIWRIISALMIVGAIVALWAIIASWIDHRLSLNLEGKNTSARGRTLLALFRNAFTVAICIFGTMIALSQLGIDIAPLLAGAGVIGLAIGFGSQKLVQDIITGVFIQLENAMNEGDIVSVGGITGMIEKLTIRSVGMRDVGGVYHIIPFSSVDTVSNLTREFSYHVEVVGVAYKEKIPAVKEAMVEAFERLKTTEHAPFIIADLEMHGVVALSESSVDVRVRIKTLPGKHLSLGRTYTELVKEVFDERDIQIPFPHRQLIMTPADPED